MKKVLGGMLLASAVLSGTAMADCRDKCVTRVFGKCVARVKVCDIGSPANWVEQAGKESTKFFDSVTETWHQVYGIMPENIRNILNNNGFTLIGGIYGGLEGLALGQAVDQLIVRAQARMIKTKEVIDASPEWKKPLLEQGLAIATLEDGTIVFTGQASKQTLVLQIDPFYNQFLTCMAGAVELNQGWECLYSLEDQAKVVVRTAQRQ